MKRRLIKQVCALLLAGAIINIAIAWASAVFIPAAQQTSLSGWRNSVKNRTGRGWDIYRYEQWSAARLIANVRVDSMMKAIRNDDDLYPRWSVWPRRLDTILIEAVASNPGNRSFSGAQMLELRGWPMFSMQAYWNGNDASVDHTKRWHWGISLSSAPTIMSGGVNLNDLKVLPLLPFWPGFVINTLFYAAIIWSVFVAPLQLRRVTRARRGLCIACGYPIGTNPVCTECGAALPAQARQSSM